MRSIKLNSYKLWLIVAFLAAFYLTHLPGLYYDGVNPDSVNWHQRSEQFANGLKYFQLEKTYQHYQPGVTLMWIIGPTVELIKQFYPGHETYTIESFPTFHFASRLVLTHVQLVLTGIAFWLLKKFTDWKVAALAVALFTFEPFFVGNSRELHLDVLLTLLMFVGLLYSFWSLKEFSWKRSALAGVFLGLSFLTKSIGIGSFLFAAGFGLAYLWKQKDRGVKYAVSLLLTSLLAIVLFFPALWKEPAYVIDQIYDGVSRVGIEGGHNQILFGQETRDGGWIFYPLVLVLKISPVLLVGLVLYLAKLKKKLPQLSLTTYLAIFYLGYFVVMSIGSKKIDRYMLPEYPFLAFVAAQGIFAFRGSFKKLWVRVLALVFVGAFLIWPLISLRPYYFTYTNPLFGNPQFVHDNILAQKPFGLGVFALRDYIYDNFGPDVNIAFLDPKPFFFLHDKDRVKYVEVDGTRAYEILVLGVNEPMPDKVKQSIFKYDYFGSLYINGLEYWKVYVRGDTKKF